MNKQELADLIKLQNEHTADLILDKYADVLWAGTTAFTDKDEPRDNKFFENMSYQLFPIKVNGAKPNQQDHCCLVLHAKAVNHKVRGQASAPANAAEHNPLVCTDALLAEEGDTIYNTWEKKKLNVVDDPTYLIDIPGVDPTTSEAYMYTSKSLYEGAKVIGTLSYTTSPEGTHLCFWSAEGKAISSVSSQTYAPANHMLLMAVSGAPKPSEGWARFFEGYGASQEAAQATIGNVRYETANNQIKRMGFVGEIKIPKNSDGLYTYQKVDVQTEVIGAYVRSEVNYDLVMRWAIITGVVIPILYGIYTSAAMVRYIIRVSPSNSGTIIDTMNTLAPISSFGVAVSASLATLATLAVAFTVEKLVIMWADDYINKG